MHPYGLHARVDPYMNGGVERDGDKGGWVGWG
jgi:hypothetical protein